MTSSRRAFLSLSALIALIAGSSACAKPAAPKGTPADLVVVNGKVYPGAGGAFAQAVAVRGNQVVLVGSNEQVKELAGAATRVLDARGGAVVPGFNDSHLHVISGGLALQQAQLGDASTIAGLQEAIRRFATAHPDRPWVLGRGWTYTAVPGGLPDQAASRRGGVRPAGPHGRLRRPHQLGEHQGAPHGGHHEVHARSRGRNDCEGPENRGTDRRAQGARAGTRAEGRAGVDRGRSARGGARRREDRARVRRDQRAERRRRTGGNGAVRRSPEVRRPEAAGVLGDGRRAGVQRSGRRPHRPAVADISATTRSSRRAR